MACRSFISSSTLITMLVSIVRYALVARTSGSIPNFCKASRFGASTTQKVRCPDGSEVQDPSILISCFFISSSTLPINSEVTFLDFSLNQSQFSGECVRITIKVGILKYSPNQYCGNLLLTASTKSLRVQSMFRYDLDMYEKQRISKNRIFP